MTESVAVPMPEVVNSEGISAWNLVPFLLSERESGRIIQANGAVSELTGYTPEQLRLMSVFDLGLWVSPGQRAESCCTAVAYSCQLISRHSPRRLTRSATPVSSRRRRSSSGTLSTASKAVFFIAVNDKPSRAPGTVPRGWR